MHSHRSDTGDTRPEHFALPAPGPIGKVMTVMASACEILQADGDTAGPGAGILAIGKQGRDILNALPERLPFLGLSIAIDSDAALLDAARADHKVLVGNGQNSPLTDEDMRHMVESALPEILDAIADLHLVFLIADMAETTGCASAPVIAHALVKQCALSFAFVTVRGNLESNPVAQTGIGELQDQGIAILPFLHAPPESICARDGIVSPAVVAFMQLWRGIVLPLWGTSECNINFEDLRQILCKPGRCVAGFGSAVDVKTAIDVALHVFDLASLRQGLLRHASSVLMGVGGQPRDHEIARKMLIDVRGNLSTEAVMGYGEYAEGHVSVFILACGVGSPVDSFVMRDLSQLGRPS